MSHRMLSFVFALCVLCCECGVAQPLMAPLAAPDNFQGDARVENWKGKKILFFTPHPDDDTFSSGGTLAKLAAQGNEITIVIYTNDDKGSKDLEMTCERLEAIRRAEEEKACEILGIAKDRIFWLGYHDGDLEYADPRKLRGEACRLIKKFRPDAVFSPDPGTRWVEWHKTDHRMAANITKDAFIAAEWHLYYPEHMREEGLKPYSVPLAFYYYSQEPNYEVDITPEFPKKIEASLAHVSQWEPSNTKYVTELPELARTLIGSGFAAEQKVGDKYIERFRREMLP